MQLPANTTRKLLTVHEAAAYVKMSKSWLDKQRLVGGFAAVCEDWKEGLLRRR